jgi:hypothetical protein
VGPSRSVVAESKVAAYAAQLEEPLDDGWAGNHGEVVTVRAGMSIGLEDEMQTGGVHELQPAQIEDHTFETGVSQFRDLFGQLADRAHVEFADGHDAHDFTLGLDVNAKGRELLMDCRSGRCHRKTPPPSLKGSDEVFHSPLPKRARTAALISSSGTVPRRSNASQDRS